MWNQYRKLKPLAGIVLSVLAVLLMDGPPDMSARWYVGMGIAAVLILAYVVEEVVWIARHEGRPCAECGHPLRVRPFRLLLRCPHCGEKQ